MIFKNYEITSYKRWDCEVLYALRLWDNPVAYKIVT